MKDALLFLAPQPYFRLRGMCIAQRETLRALTALGLRVEVLTFPFGTDDAPAGAVIERVAAPSWISDVPIGPSWSKLRLDLSLFASAWRRLRRGGVGAVLACEESVFIAALFKPFFGYRLIYDMDDILSARLERSGWLKFRPLLAVVRGLERWALRSSDFVLTNSAETTAAARAAAGPARVAFYHHAPPVSPGPLREEEKAGEHILYAGNLERYQGLDLLLAALPRVLAARPAVRCTIVGGTPRQIAAGRETARAYGVGHAVSWPGPKPLEEAFELMSAADALVSPMTQEKAVPMKLYAYMLSGTPIVATDLPNHRQLLHDGNAYLCEASPGPLARALLSALDGAEAGRLAARACADAESALEDAAQDKALRKALGLPPVPPREFAPLD